MVIQPSLVCVNSHVPIENHAFWLPCIALHLFNSSLLSSQAMHSIFLLRSVLCFTKETSNHLLLTVSGKHQKSRSYELYTFDYTCI